MASSGVSRAKSIQAGEVTILLQRLQAGDAAVRTQLVELLYPQLKRLASIRMRSERNDHTLQPTALVSELFLKLARDSGWAFNNRAHFLAVASKLMRRLLIDYARAISAQKRRGIKVQLEGLDLPAPFKFPNLLEVNELLEQLSVEDPRTVQVLELHWFGGLTFREVADTIGIDERTAKRDWKFAQSWLAAQLSKGKVNVRRGLGAN
ncbi:MAG TPA: ECF-type sigma factor [Terriglobia bacterium]|nr:ECF-type sigma factor [Terriglobia bacterium]